MARQTSPMIGRDRELAALCDMVAAAGRGEPAVAVVAGDAGVGKSRLVAELCTRMRTSGATVLAGHCVNLPDGGLPYLPFVDAFRQLDTPAWHWLEPHLRGGAAETLGQLQLYEAVVELLFELSEQAPVCLVVEDLHWADRPSRDLLRYLIGRLERERVALVLTYRSDDLHRRHPLRPFLADIARMPAVQRIVLEPLPAAAIEELVSAEGPVDPCVLSDIVARAEGNAFFAEELLEAGRASGDGGSLPEALRDVLITRLEQLDSSAARVVGVAAVAGRRVGHEVLAAVTGLPDAELDAALREAVARHVLEPDAESGTYQFRHALMQEAAYSDLLPGERVRLHREYAQVLQGLLESTPAVAAELAHHAEVSHDLPLALAASVRAARHARAVHAPSEAQRHLERALEWWCSIPDAAERAGMSESELYRQAAEAAGAAGDPVRAAALVQGADERLVAEIGSDPGPADRERLAVMRAHLAVARYYIGDMRDEQAAREATELIEGLPVSAARAEVRATEAFMMFVHGSDGAGEVAERALADAVAVGADNVQAEALVTLARVAERRGDADTAAAHFTRALELARSSGDVAAELRCLFNLATSRYDAGDLPATLHWTQRSIERAAASGMRYSDYAREARGIDVIARYVSGDWDTSLRGAVFDADRTPANARPLLEAFILHIAVGRGMADVPDRIDRLFRINHPDPFANAQLVMLAGGCQIDHLTWQQDYEGAQAAYRRVIEVPVRLWGEHYLGRIWLDALALAALAERASLARLRGDSHSARLLAELAAEGEALVEDARDTAKHGVPRGGRLGVEGVAWLARAEAEWSRLLGENDDTVWRATVAAFDYGYRYEVARSRWRLAEVLITRAANGQGSSRDGAANSAGAAEEAAELLRSAYQDAQALGAAPLAEAVAALARRAKITGVGRTSSVTLLTTREQEVLGLLARGRTNRQLGKELFISEKTASVHVSNILAKLEAGSRGEAVAIARQRGLI